MAVKDRLLEEFERYSQDMAACTKDGRSCKPRSLIIDGAAFALIDDGPMTSLHGPTVGSVPVVGKVAMTWLKRSALVVDQLLFDQCLFFSKGRIMGMFWGRFCFVGPCDRKVFCTHVCVAGMMDRLL